MAILRQLANAALAKSVPAFDKWLRARLGDSTRVGSAKMEGSRVVVEDAQLMLGPRVRLEIDRAAIAMVGRGLEGPRLYVASAEGNLVVTGAGRELRARLKLESGHDRGDAWLAGEVVVDDGRFSDEEGAPCMRGKLDVEVSLKRWQLGGRLAVADATHDIDASGRIGAAEPIAKLRIELLESPLGLIVRHAETWLDSRSPRLPVAPTARGTGAISWQRSVLGGRTRWTDVTLAGHPWPAPITVETALEMAPGRATGAITLHTARSSVRVSGIDWAATRLVDACIEGQVAVADVMDALEGLAPLRLAEGGEATFRLRLSGGANDWCARGDAHVTELSGGLVDPPATFSIEKASAEVVLDAQGAALTALSFAGYGSLFEGDAELRFAPPSRRLVLRFTDADHELVCALAALGRVTLEAEDDARPRPVGAHRIARDARLSGQLAVAHDGEVRGELALETRDTALLVALTVSAPRGDDGSFLDGTQLRGRLSSRDAVALGWLDGPIELLPGSSWNVNAQLKGPLADPSVDAQLESASCRVGLWGSVELPLTDLSLSLCADREALVWRAARAKLWSGQVEVEGVRGNTHAFRGIDCAVSWTEVALGRATVLGTPLADHVEGRSRGELHARRLDDGRISGNGRITVVDVQYFFVRFAQRQLADVGLPLPHAGGAGPLSCSVALGDNGVRFTAIEAATDEITVRGGVDVGFDGALAGLVTARLRGGYLQKSPLFVIPASLAGGITVPVSVGGSLAAPTLAADLRTALRDKLGTDEISSALAGAVEGLRVAADGAAGALDSFLSGFGVAPPTAPNGGRELEAIVARCLADDPNTDELIDRLIDAGVTSDDIVAVLERRRARER